MKKISVIFLVAAIILGFVSCNDGPNIQYVYKDKIVEREIHTTDTVYVTNTVYSGSHIHAWAAEGGVYNGGVITETADGQVASSTTSITLVCSCGETKTESIQPTVGLWYSTNTDGTCYVYACYYDGSDYQYCDCTATDLIIPSTYTDLDGNQYSVTSIGNPENISCSEENYRGFYSTDFDSVFIPSSVKLISPSTFFYLSCLTDIVISKGITEIGCYAFENCTGLKSICLPDSLTTISDYVFEDCYSLTRVVLPDGLNCLSEGLFYDCYTLSDVNIPSSLTTISDYVFYGCYLLDNIELPDSVEYIGDDAFNCCYQLNSIEFSNSLKYIGDDAFNCCYSLQNVILPNSVEYLGYHVFEDCDSLRSVILSDNITKLNYETFESCNDLRSVHLPESLTTIESSIFYYCTNLKEVTLPASFTSVEKSSYHWYGVFDYSGVKQVVFEGDNFTSVTDENGTIYDLTTNTDASVSEGHTVYYLPEWFDMNRSCLPTCKIVDKDGKLLATGYEPE